MNNFVFDTNIWISIFWGRKTHELLHQIATHQILLYSNESLRHELNLVLKIILQFALTSVKLKNHKSLKGKMLTIPMQMGVNAPKEHQRVIRKLIYHLSDLYLKKEILYEPFPETMIDESQTSPTPDILLYDEETRKFVVIIEISATQGFKKDFKKITELCQTYEVLEGFVFDYVSHKWKRYSILSNEAKDSSYCNTIDQDLEKFV